ncbi:MAG TPA: hypothetical protein VEF34_13510 [Syntrophobacteraceae bacterium]|nr:hypothetical protein [Syntrophobacteraceae bacterium]
MTTYLRRLMVDPCPLRHVAKKVIQKLRIGSYEQRMRLGAVDRPNYAYCVYNAAVLAKRLRYQRISVLEFGVAGGNGLVNLEYHAQNVSKRLAIDIDIYGFDTGVGLPEPLDYRDLPYRYKKGFLIMDVPKLRARLKKAQLVLGDINNTSKAFLEEYSPAPIGAIMYDVDFYSSAAAALKMLEAPERYYLPRVFCYFDDIIEPSCDTVSTDLTLHNDYTGERLAINEFNQAHNDIKLAVPYHLLARWIVEQWYHQIRVCHFFKHSRYNEFVYPEAQELPLE